MDIIPDTNSKLFKQYAMPVFSVAAIATFGVFNFIGTATLVDAFITTKFLVGDSPAQMAVLADAEAVLARWYLVAGEVEINLRRRVSDSDVDLNQLQDVLAGAVGKNIQDAIRSESDSLDTLFAEAGNERAQALVQTIAKDAIDREVGQRGFLITGVDSFEEPYYAGGKNLTEHIEQLNQLIDRGYQREEMQQVFTSLSSSINQWQEAYEERESALGGEASSLPLWDVEFAGSDADLPAQIGALLSETASAFNRAGNLRAENYALATFNSFQAQTAAMQGLLTDRDTASRQHYKDSKAELFKHSSKLGHIIDGSYSVGLARRHLDRIDEDKKDLALAESIVRMAHALELDVVAEGVENEAQAGLLRDIGCGYLQGYLFGKPVPAEEFELMLVNNHPLVIPQKSSSQEGIHAKGLQ